MGSLEGAVRFSINVANGPYRYGSFDCSDRCNPAASGCADCSGLVCASVRSQGRQVACLGSFAIARICHQAGLGLSLEDARAERGALVFIGTHEGQGGIAGVDPGHVARSLGNGLVVEARNHRAGILVGNFDNRGWVYGAHDPWLWKPGSPPKPLPVPVQEEDMQIISLGDDAASNTEPTLTFVFKGGPTGRGVILSQYEARVAWDVNHGDDAPLGGTHDPKTIGIPGRELITGIAVDEQSRTTVNGKTRVRIRAIGAQGGQWPGLAHG